ncbi:3-keto-disaccharide hydrolase [Tautonia plasticadhaerens]|uniref:3-keto-alpha-glucoside-1,2-lyase/3-keto-2-hydroxy-glucal hydratase domain-containing protein n=1 Tax=Tautonia plasticadhaerens TaxID=2527974 RepID=A0A518H8Y3_9BACT|nr:DUF1080 domain-containing protein [Tautonia plasticadhaerens]QDV37312.1 hypothetical protein ElP_52470 [Tautonia plasticadhaerens]
MIRRSLLAGMALVCPTIAWSQEPIRLFNGEDLSGWTAVLAGEDARAEDVWTVRDGVLSCSGKPNGYIRTEESYKDYTLTLEWRFPEGSDGGNSGVLVHTSEPGAIGIWPKSIEVQLFSGNAGDFWVIGTDLDVENEEQRKMGRRHLNLTDDSERPIGEWNEMEIVCEGDAIRVSVNGDLVNQATNCTVTEGAISLQSEGVPIEFREVVLTPMGE